MADLPELNEWTPGVYQLETSDPVLGGPEGIDNLQAKQLANRTLWLKGKLDALFNGTTTAGKATKLSTPQAISISGDATGTVNFDGSSNVDISLTLADLSWSKITSGKPNTLGGYGITDAYTKAVTYTRTEIEALLNVAVVGSHKNLSVSANGLNALLSVSADQLVVGTGIAIKNLSAINVTINAANVGANGLDTGALAVSSWYSVWVICGVAGVAGLLSLSATDPVLPAGYTYKARVSWARSDGTANKFFLAFRQFGRQVRYVVGVGTNVASLPSMAGGILGNPAGGAWVAVSVDPFVPVTASAIDFFVFSQSAGSYYMVADTSSYGPYLSSTNPPPISSGASTSSSAVDFWRSMSRLMLTSGRNIYCAANSADFNIRCLGWEDNL